MIKYSNQNNGLRSFNVVKTDKKQRNEGAVQICLKIFSFFNIFNMSNFIIIMRM